MVKSLMIMDLPPWLSGAGNRSRVNKLIQFLTKYSFLTIIFLGKRPAFDIEHLIPRKTNLIYLDSEDSHDKSKNLQVVNNLLVKDHYRICIIEYIHLSYFVQCVPDDVITILDTHDIVSDSNKSFNDFNHENFGFNISQQQEYLIYQLFDYVMFISSKDYAKSTEFLEEEKMLLAPHPASIMKHKLNDKVKSIGFVASDYTPNVDSILWFIENVWSLFPLELGLKLNIYGAICNKISPMLTRSQHRSIYLQGYQSDLSSIYKQIDIAINPVRFGAGLKIKNIEALANGIPLITTLHGASGLEDQIGKSLLVCTDADDFFTAIMNLVINKTRRVELSRNSHQFITDNFTDEHCFKDLKKLLLS